MLYYTNLLKRSYKLFELLKEKGYTDEEIHQYLEFNTPHQGDYLREVFNINEETLSEAL